MLGDITSIFVLFGNTINLLFSRDLVSQIEVQVQSIFFSLSLVQLQLQLKNCFYNMYVKNIQFTKSTGQRIHTFTNTEDHTKEDTTKLRNT